MDTMVLECLEASDYTWKELQKLLVQATMNKYRSNKTHAAKSLGISIRTLRTKCKEFRI